MSDLVMAEVQNIKKYVVQFPAELRQRMGVENPSLGSGLSFSGFDSDGDPTFLMLTDRGPNIAGPSFRMGLSVTQKSTIFPAPSYAPSFATIKVKGDVATVVAVTTLRRANGPQVSGLPPVTVSKGAEFDIPLDEHLQRLPSDLFGIDPEGVTNGGDGLIWICDEYGPSILAIELASGRVVQALSPGKGLPVILTARQVNRGFEGITISRDGKIYASLQSTLDIELATKNTSTFIRIIEYDPNTAHTRTFAYPIGEISKKTRDDVKLGDLVWVDEGKLLVIETYEEEDNGVSRKIMLLDFVEATDISNVEHQGKPLEFFKKDISDLITLARKSVVLDLNTIGWHHEKTEGIALLPDQRTIAIVNDSDFGVKGEVKLKLEDFESDGESLRFHPEREKEWFRVKQEPAETHLWLITMDRVIE